MISALRSRLELAWLWVVKTFWGLAAALLRILPETLFALALLGGWTLVTWGLASLIGWRVWPISFGILLLSSCGWKMLWVIASQGLYALSRSDEK